MPKGVFIAHWDDFRGLVVEHKYPTSIMLTEKDLNMVYYHHEKGRTGSLQYVELENMRVASLASSGRPLWIVVFVLDEGEEIEGQEDVLLGMGRYVLAMLAQHPEGVDVKDVLENQRMLHRPTPEQEYADIFLTPSSALLLERMEQEGIDRATRLAVWLNTQVQSEEIDIRAVAAPLMKSGVVRVEKVQGAGETVFLVRDVFAYRAPPVQALQYALETMVHIAEVYQDRVTEFFSPPPPEKGYNPTAATDDPNSPLLEDRQRIAEILRNGIHYEVVRCLRERPMTLAEISQATTFPVELVQKVLWALEAEKVTTHVDGGSLWVLLTDPTIEAFMPEFVLPDVFRKMKDRELDAKVVMRYLELLDEEWGRAE